MVETNIEAILTLLAQNQIEFVVIGGVAALAHGSARATFDVDVCYRRTKENVARLCNTLAPLNPRLRGVTEDIPFIFDSESILLGLNFTFTTDMGDLDLLGEVAGIGMYDQVLMASERGGLYGLTMNVLTIEGLLKAKRAAGRRKDLEAIIELEALRDLNDPPSVTE
ncbi:MAG: hypothetical protein HC853_02225 [Anaerolineae bacterium]|nr:hypothetical protein [Anaerolineae bacterium]